MIFWIRKLLAPKTKLDERLGHSTNPKSVGGTNSPTRNLPSTLASVTCLVQYCVNTCSAVDAAQRKIRYLQAHGRRSAATKIFRRKGRPDERHRSVGWTGFREMIASGWQTAPPQVIDFEVVLVTNSACRLSLEASPRVPDPPCVAPRKLSQSTPRAELFQHLAPVIESRSRASASPILSAPR
jgi:hypothetical protein